MGRPRRHERIFLFLFLLDGFPLAASVLPRLREAGCLSSDLYIPESSVRASSLFTFFLGLPFRQQKDALPIESGKPQELPLL